MLDPEQVRLSILSVCSFIVASIAKRSAMVLLPEGYLQFGEIESNLPNTQKISGMPRLLILSFEQFFDWTVSGNSKLGGKKTEMVSQPLVWSLRQNSSEWFDWLYGISGT